MYNGIINVYKEKGFTSFDVVAKLRGVFHQKKIGHTGTLDPDAEGVLPVCLGKATKVCELLTDKDKEYEAVMLLGQETDTQDISGKIIRTKEVQVSEEEIQKTIMSFVGSYQQIPPMYSALKINGRKLCDLAREGVTVERKAREVVIYSIEILKIRLPRVRMKVHCSKGTYIRTLCQDIGERLGCFGCMESLLRTRVADFVVAESLTISQIEDVIKNEPQNVNRILKQVDILFGQYPKALVSEKADKFVANGNRIPDNLVSFVSEEDKENRIRLYTEKGQFIGLYSYQQKEKDYKPIKIFMD